MESISENCIIGLCRDASEGLHLYRTLKTRHPDMSAFCIFYGVNVDPSALSEIPSTSRFLLGAGSGEESAIRAGMIWVSRLNDSLENVLFCYAEEIPEAADVDLVLLEVTLSGEWHASESCWGMSLTWAVLKGWVGGYRCWFRPLDEIEGLSEMGSAMRGKCVNSRYLARAVIEVMPENLSVVSDSLNAACAEFNKRVLTMVPSIRQGSVRGLLTHQVRVPDSRSLGILIDDLDTSGVLGVTCHDGAEVMKGRYAPYRPHRVLRGKNGVEVLLFGRNAMEVVI